VVPRIGQRVAWRGVRYRGIVEVSGCQAGVLIVIGRLVPLVLPR
jgi:hypothetical protein